MVEIPEQLAALPARRIRELMEGAPAEIRRGILAAEEAAGRSRDSAEHGAIGFALVAAWLQSGARLVEVSNASIASFERCPPRLHAAVNAPSGPIAFQRPGTKPLLIVAPNPLGNVLVTWWWLQNNGHGFLSDELTPLSVCLGQTVFHEQAETSRIAEAIVRTATTGYAAVCATTKLPPPAPPNHPPQSRPRAPGPRVQRLTLDDSLLFSWLRTMPPRADPKPAEPVYPRGPMPMHAVSDYRRRIWVTDPGPDEALDIREGKRGYLYLVWRPVQGYMQGAGTPSVKRARLVTGPDDLR